MEEIRLTEEQYDEKAQELFAGANLGLEKMAASKYLCEMRNKLFPDSESARKARRITELKGLAVRIIRDMEKNCQGRQPDNLKDTVDGMLSDDYKERFIAEFQQVKIRYKKLKKFCNKIEAARRNGTEEPKHDCPLELLREQQKHMGQYLYTLEVRAEIERIDLP